MYRIMFVSGLALSGVFLICSIVLFFRNRISKLIGDLTGWNAKKAIKKKYVKHTETTLKTEIPAGLDGTITRKLKVQEETGLRLTGVVEPLPEIFEVVEDITEFYRE